jgi:MFS family permease
LTSRGLLANEAKFLALGFVCPVGCAFTLVTSVIVRIQTDLNDTTDKATWLVGGWSLASAVSFCLAGSVSDLFGRRYTILSGQLICVIGCVRLVILQTCSILTFNRSLQPQPKLWTVSLWVKHSSALALASFSSHMPALRNSCPINGGK